MACRCSANALRLFVRNVTQVDILAGSSSFRSLHQRPLAANRTFSGYRTLTPQRRMNSALASEPVSAKSIGEEALSNTIASEPPSTESIEQNEFEDFHTESTYEPSEPPTNDENIEPIMAEPAQLDGLPETPSESPYPNDGSPSTDAAQVYSVERYKSRRVDSEAQPDIRASDLDNAFVDFSHEAINAMAEEVAGAKSILGPTPVINKEPTIPERSRRDDEIELASSLRVLGLRRGRKGLPKSTFKISRSSSLEPMPPRIDDWVPPKKEPWQIQKARLKEKFPEGWNPLKKLSPDAMVGIRQLHAQMPEKYTTGFLADHFKVSPDSIRRILRSKWQPDADTQINKDMRWFRRGERVWSRYAELGVKPPRRWRDEGIGRGKPEWKKKAQQQSSRVVPALLTTTRRDGGFYGSDGSSSNPRTGAIPQLVTTRRPDH